MKHEIIMSGFGGQGIMVMGQLLTYAGMIKGNNVSWMPSYGPEMRGGTANCSVIIADTAIGAPVVTCSTAAVIMNGPSLDKFEESVKPGGAVIINSSLVSRDVQRQDVKSYLVPINNIANELGNEKMVNMVALGALIAASDVVDKETLMSAFAKKFAAKPKIVPANQAALDKGYDYVMQLKAAQ